LLFLAVVGSRDLTDVRELLRCVSHCPKWQARSLTNSATGRMLHRWLAAQQSRTRRAEPHCRYWFCSAGDGTHQSWLSIVCETPSLPSQPSRAGFQRGVMINRRVRSATTPGGVHVAQPGV